MATYILMLTLTPEGREKTLYRPESVLRAADSIKMHGIQLIGLYGVLGAYDFVGILEAPDNENAARFSLRLGVSAGLHVETLPAIPVARLEGAMGGEPTGVETGVARERPSEADGEGPEESEDPPYA